MHTDFTRLQGEQKMKWEDWYSYLVDIYAKEMKLDKVAALRHVNVSQAFEWYNDGFTPYGCFRENAEF